MNVNSLRVPSPTRSRVPGRRLGLLLGALALFLSACTSGVTPETYCYSGASATIHSVDTGMKIAADLYKQGKVSEAGKAKLIAAHDIYRPAAQAAVAGCKAIGSQGDADKILAELAIAADKILESLVAAGVLP